MNVNVYCCGGAALNLGLKFEQEYSTEGRNQINVIYLDLGLSNIKSDHDSERTFIIPCSEEDKNGSGQLRSANAESVINNVDRILSTFEPAQFNIVLSSTSGGSGAVINHVLTDTLLKNDHVVIPMLIGTYESETSANNTVKALNGFYRMVEDNNKPLAIYYASNGENTYNQEVDTEILSTLYVICEAITIEPHGLDNADLTNFFHWNATIDSPNELALLETYIDVDEYEESECLASLRFSKDGKEVDKTGLYKVVQTIDEDYPNESIDITISNENVSKMFKEADKQIERIQNEKRKRSAAFKRDVSTGSGSSLQL